MCAPKFASGITKLCKTRTVTMSGLKIIKWLSCAEGGSYEQGSCTDAVTRGVRCTVVSGGWLLVKTFLLYRPHYVSPSQGCGLIEISLV